MVEVHTMKEMPYPTVTEDQLSISAAAGAPIALPAMLGRETSVLLMRMFRDARVLEQEERGDLIAQLKSAVELEPRLPELRVLLGMALCVDLQAQEALEQLRESARQAPDCFIARLKFGELLMRLRICSQAAEETHKAAQLACNPVQSDLARRQAAAIRTMLREGIERGGYQGLLGRVVPLLRRKSKQNDAAPVLVESR